MQSSRGYSIHIGLNHVDPTCYNGWDGQLSGCINDATDMKSIADSLGYQSLILTDGQATSSNVIAQIGGAAQELTDGDILFLTYSGHGGQVPDVNGDEDDGQDETWVLYDRQLIDDELYALWSQFQSGVRIVMLSDSCHSGTVLRMIATYADLKRDVRRSKAPPSPDTLAVISQLEKTLGIQGAREAVAAAAPMPPASPDGGGVATLTRPAPAPAPAAAPAAEAIPDVTRVKTMPAEIRDLVNTARAADDGSRQWIAGNSTKAMVQASVILISGCQDSQVSMDGARNGLFTEKLRQVWADGAFGGDYHQFHSQIVAKMPSSQTPNFATTGVANSAFEAQKPFTIAAVAGGGGSSPTPTTTTRPTLKRGDTGPDVTYLQQKLQQQGYSITADGIFGFNTEGRVRDFQATRGLTVDGIVGQQTWQALEGSAVGPAPQPGPPAPSPSGSSRPTIRRGSTGTDVTYLQQRLRVFNYNVATDGIFGPMTESAVRSFQASNGLAVDGIVGQQTWAALG